VRAASRSSNALAAPPVSNAASGRHLPGRSLLR